MGPVRGRFVFALVDAFHSVWYGYSTDATGTSWVFGNNGQAVFSSSAAIWDYPSIGADASGRIIVGAVKLLTCTPPVPSPDPMGYYAALSPNGTTFPTPSAVVPFTRGCDATYSGFSGSGGRVVATQNRFGAFVPSLNQATGTYLPTYVGRWESSDGVGRNGDLGIGMGSFGAPNNNTPGSHSTAFCCFYAPLFKMSIFAHQYGSLRVKAAIRCLEEARDRPGSHRCAGHRCRY